MKKFVEKLISRLNDELPLFASGWRKDMNNIVNQLAEEYKEQNIDQDLMIVASLPSLYPMMQPFEVEAIDRVVSSAKDSNTFCEWKYSVEKMNYAYIACNGDEHLRDEPLEFEFCPYCGKKIKLVEQ